MFGWISVFDLRFGPDYSFAENFSSLLGIIFFSYSFFYPVAIAYLYLSKFKPLINLIEFEEKLISLSAEEINEFLDKEGTIAKYLNKF